MTPSDTIADLLVAALNQKLASDDWEFADQTTVEACEFSELELAEVSDTTQIRIAPYAGLDNQLNDRGSITVDLRIGIFIVRKLDMTNGKPDRDQFRALKGLAYQILKWVYRAAEGYEKKCIGVDFPALYDLAKAKQGVFATMLTPRYRLGESI